ncbi:MAG: sulfatase-like hydrolase/transferase [Planctomycetota bacterium]|jgi:arylsulfatase
MNRRDFLRISGAGALTLALGRAAGAGRSASKRPNIIFIMADDLGYNELGCYGQQKIKTPNVDLLASQGMLFTDYYTGSAVCAPARCNLMTGKHGGHAHIRNNSEVGGWDSFRGQLPLPQDTMTIAGLLKKQGYVTGAFGKWGLGEVGSTGDPLNQGFDRFFGYNCQRHAHNLFPNYLVDDAGKVTLEGNTRGLTGEKYGPQMIADQMLEFIRDNRNRRFFVYYPSVLPHLALQAPQEDIDRYKGRWPETPYEGKSYLPHPTPKACYAAMISFLDKQVGRLTRLLKELDLENDTIVFFTSDNGTTYLKGQVDYEFFESVGPLRGLKGSLYEGGIRVPMVVRWPGRIRAGSKTAHAAAHYDVMATLADVVGIDMPEDTDGTSFLPTLLSKPRKQKKPEYLFWDFTGYGGQLAVRMGRWKGIKQNVRKNPDAPLELYDLEADIGESDNVAAENPAVTAKIERIMLEARRRPSIERFQFGRYPD